MITKYTDSEIELRAEVAELKSNIHTLVEYVELLQKQISGTQTKLALFDKPLPTTQELFDIYCNDKLAGEWHNARQNYEAGFLAALKWIVKPKTEVQITTVPNTLVTVERF